MRNCLQWRLLSRDTHKCADLERRPFAIASRSPVPGPKCLSHPVSPEESPRRPQGARGGLWQSFRWQGSLATGLLWSAGALLPLTFEEPPLPRRSREQVAESACYRRRKENSPHDRSFPSLECREREEGRGRWWGSSDGETSCRPGAPVLNTQECVRSPGGPSRTGAAPFKSHCSSADL